MDLFDTPKELVNIVEKILADKKAAEKKTEKIDVDPEIADPNSPTNQRS